MKRFENLGYFIEYFINGKFMGIKKVNKPDRNILGFMGGIKTISNETIILDNNKTIKKGVSYTSYLQQLNGKKL